MSVTRAATLPQLLLYAVRERPWWSGLHILGAADQSGSITLSYVGLLDAALRILGGLQKHQRPRGTYVALLLEHAADFIPAFWACVLGGFIPCPLAPARPDSEGWSEQIAHQHTLLDGPLLLTTRATRQMLPAMTVVELDTLRGSAPGRIDPAGHTKPSEVALIALGSGPANHSSQAVVLTHATLLAALTAKAMSRQLTAKDVILNCEPFHRIEGLLDGHLLPLLAGALQIHAPPAGIVSEPLSLLRLIARHKVSSVAAPAFLLAHIHAALQPAQRKPRPLRVRSIDLSCVRQIVLAGPVDVKRAREVLDLLEPCKLPRRALWPSFGMTETCGGFAYSREFPDADTGREFASVGLPLSGIDLRIADLQDAIAKGLGEVQLRGPMLFQRYYSDAQATHAAFTSDGWFHTGYVGCIENNCVDLNDWSQDPVVIGGVAYRYRKLEILLEELEGIEKGYVAAFVGRPERAIREGLVVAFAASVAVEDEAGLYQLTRAVRTTVIANSACRPMLILPLPKDMFIEARSGTTRRWVLRKRLESGELAMYQTRIGTVAARLEGQCVRAENAVEATIVKVYSDMFGIDPGNVSTTASCFDLGCTSIEALQLRRKLQQDLGLADLPLSTLLHNPTPRGLAACIATERLDKGREYDALVPLQRSGSNTPLFCVHSDGGEVLAFINLAQYFGGERPVYALRARGFNRGERHFETFAEMIRTYVRAIRKRQARGPYALLGYSYGSLIAVEIARALETRGERVAFLGCVEPLRCPQRQTAHTDALQAALDLGCSLGLINETQAQEISKYRGMSTLIQDSCEYLIRMAPHERLIELDLDLAKFKAWAAVVQSLSTLHRSYSPSGAVQSMSVFYPQPSQHGREREPIGQPWSWDKLSHAPVRCNFIDVSDEQLALLDPQPTVRLQAAIRAELDPASSKSDSGLKRSVAGESSTNRPGEGSEGEDLTDDALFTDEVFADVLPIVSRHLRNSQ